MELIGELIGKLIGGEREVFSSLENILRGRYCVGSSMCHLCQVIFCLANSDHIMLTGNVQIWAKTTSSLKPM